jgi:hypothetical protein
VSGRDLACLSVLLLIGACQKAPEQPPHIGHLEVRWTGRDGGAISGPATARWCALRRVLEIRTVRGDTGIALALYPAKTLAIGRYLVVDPVKAESVPPAAGVAVRWLTRTVVQGFQGDSGRVDLSRSSSGQLSGRVSARARSVVDTQRIVLSGTFRDLTLHSDSLGCAPPENADSGDEDGEDDGEPSDPGVPGDTGVH